MHHIHPTCHTLIPCVRRRLPWEEADSIRELFGKVHHVDFRLLLQGQRAALGPGAWPDPSQRRLSSLILHAPSWPSGPSRYDRGPGEPLQKRGVQLQNHLRNPGRPQDLCWPQGGREDRDPDPSPGSALQRTASQGDVAMQTTPDVSCFLFLALIFSSATGGWLVYIPCKSSINFWSEKKRSLHIGSGLIFYPLRQYIISIRLHQVLCSVLGSVAIYYPILLNWLIVDVN